MVLDIVQQVTRERVDGERRPVAAPTATLPRVIHRTVRRRAKREVLWNGNVEPPLGTFFTDPEHIVRWAIATRGKYKTSVPQLESQYPQLNVVHLGSQRHVNRWLTGPLAAALP